MRSNSLIQQYLCLKKTDPTAAERFREEHRDSEELNAFLGLAVVLGEAMREQRAKPLPPFEQHELFPAIEQSPPRTACGDSHDA